MRQPICLLLATSALGLIALLPLIVTHGLGESGKLIRDSSFAIHFLFGIGLSTFAACLTIIQEIRRGTVASILSKPVSRVVFLLAKFIGIAIPTLMFSTMCTFGTMLSARTAAEQFIIDWWSALPFLICIPFAFILSGIIHYFTDRPFVSNAFCLLFFSICGAFLFAGFFSHHGEFQSFGASYRWEIIAPSMLIAMAILVLQGIAVGLATRLDAVPTLAICTVLFLAGLMSDYFIGRHIGQNPLADILYRLVPNWQHFWQIDALNGGGHVPWSYVLASARYAAMYLCGTLLVATGLFRLMEIK